jgi:hypothetical protein
MVSLIYRLDVFHQLGGPGWPISFAGGDDQPLWLEAIYDDKQSARIMAFRLTARGSSEPGPTGPHEASKERPP